MDNETSLKRRVVRSREPFKFRWTLTISLKRLKLEFQIFAVLERRLLQLRETEASFCFYNYIVINGKNWASLQPSVRATES